MTFDLLIVGPASGKTGGITRYINEQVGQLPDWIETNIHDVRPDRDGAIPSFLATVADSLRAVASFPFRSRPQALHVHTSHGLGFYREAFYVLFARYVWNRPVVLHIHGSSFDEFVRTDNPVLHQFQAMVFESSERIIVLSEYWKRVLSTRVPESKLEVQPNAVDVEQYDPSFESEVPTVTFISNHIQRKGIIDLVEAIDRLKRTETTRFRVCLAGSGPESEHARELADRHDDVEYLGYVSEAQKRRLLSTSSIYVLPTYAEGLPIALLEGMAGGNAVISTDVGSIPEVIDDHGGQLIEPGDVDQLTTALRSLIERPGVVESMGRRNHQLVAEDYSWTTVSRELAGIYRSTVAG